MQEHTGEYGLTIDPAGRIAWPEGIVQAFGPALVFSRWLDHCLIAAPQEVWDAIRAGMQQNLPVIEHAFNSRLTAGAQTVSVDAAGRCLVPRHLRAWAGLAEKGPVTVSAQGRWVEVWSTPNLEAYLDRQMAESQARLAATMRLGPSLADGSSG